MTTATTPLLEIQRAVYQRASGDGALATLATGVFDDVPENQTHPYVQLGEAMETPRNTSTEFGREVVITLHVWDRYRGFARCLAIADRLTQLFDHQAMALTGHWAVAVRHEFTQTLRDPDPEIRHVPVRFRITTEQE